MIPIGRIHIQFHADDDGDDAERDAEDEEPPPAANREGEACARWPHFASVS